MRVLVACEFSGVVRRAVLRAIGLAGICDGARTSQGQGRKGQAARKGGRRRGPDRAGMGEGTAGEGMSERTGYLTAEEVEAAQSLHTRTPYAICDVSKGFFSVARHYGGMTYQSEHYTYFPEHDELVRDDVLKLVTKMRKRARKEKPVEAPSLDLGAP